MAGNFRATVQGCRYTFLRYHAYRLVKLAGALYSVVLIFQLIWLGNGNPTMVSLFVQSWLGLMLWMEFGTLLVGSRIRDKLQL